MAALGTRYLKETQGSNATMTRYIYSNETVYMQLSEQKSQVASNEEQIVDIVLLQKEDQSPISNVESKVTLTLPDGQQETFVSAATNPLGKTSITIPAHPA